MPCPGGRPAGQAAGRPGGRAAGERAGVVDFYNYKTWPRLQEFQQNYKSPWAQHCTQAPTRRLINKKWPKATFNRLQEFQQTTRVSTELQEFQHNYKSPYAILCNSVQSYAILCMQSHAMLCNPLQSCKVPIYPGGKVKSSCLEKGSIMGYLTTVSGTAKSDQVACRCRAEI